jgi:hypothetical protein
VAQAPTIVLFVPIKPYLQALDDTGLHIATNANWPLLFDAPADRWYLLYRDLWLTSPALDQNWQPTVELPLALNQLDPAGPHASLLVSVPAPKSTLLAPQVILRNEPAELILTVGEPALAPMNKSLGLYYVENSAAPLLRFNGRWYFLASGRWFSSDSLSNGSEWMYVNPLPDAFAAIPAEHEMSWLRASVPGTPEAHMAALEAKLPRQAQFDISDTPEMEVVYDGEPTFAAIADTGVDRATNTASQVLHVAGTYYLCYRAAWYNANSAQGPWTLTASVPDAIYKIPPSSPAYAVTDVKVAGSTAETVTTTHTDAYSSNVHVSGGVAVSSTGWYFPPYLGLMYFAYRPAYGHGSYYNPNTGAYGSRSSWSGPFGGYSYADAYNPNTNRYGYREVAWNDDGWNSYSEAYGRNRDVYAETERSFDDDAEKFEMERDFVGDNGGEMRTERTTNLEDGWQQTKRETSRGGYSEVNRSFDGEGNVTSTGIIEGADGRSATINGDYDDGDGVTNIKGSEGGQGQVQRNRNGDMVTREGEFSNSDGDTIESNTSRDGRNSKTELESSTGGQIKSVSDGCSRLTVGESSSGDVYAGHDGSVYKKTDDGWQEFDGGRSSWQSSSNSQSDSRSNQVQLERDASARNQGYANHQQRKTRGGRRGTRGRRR